MGTSRQRRRVRTLCRRRPMECQCLCHKQEVEKTQQTWRIRLWVELLRAGRLVWLHRHPLWQLITNIGQMVAAQLHRMMQTIEVWSANIVHQLGDMAHTIQYWLDLIQQALF